MSFWNDRHIDTEIAMDDPQVGDLYSEMFSFYLYVVERDGDKVVTMEGSPPCEFPNDKVKAQTVEELKARFAYGSIPGYSIKLLGRGNDVAGWYTREAQ